MSSHDLLIICISTTSLAMQMNGKPSKFAGTLKQPIVVRNKHKQAKQSAFRARARRLATINQLRSNPVRERVHLQNNLFTWPIHPDIYPYPYPETKKVNIDLLLKRQECFLQTLNNLNTTIITTLQNVLTPSPEKEAKIKIALIASRNIQTATLKTLRFFDPKQTNPTEEYLREENFLKVYIHQFELAQKLEQEIAAFQEAQKKNENKRINSLRELAQRTLPL